jgi:hypothetical protein
VSNPGRRYNYSEYGAASLLVLGIVLFTMGDVDTLPTFDPKVGAVQVCACGTTTISVGR